MKRIARDKGLFARQRRVLGRGQILDREETPVRGDHTVNGRHGQVRPLPLGFAPPLIPSRRTDDGILGDGVVVCAAEVLLPLIGARRLGLDGRRPFALLPDHHGTEGSHDAHEFSGGHLVRIIADNQGCEVVYVGEPLSVPLHHGNRTVTSKVADHIAGSFDTLGIGVDSLNDAIFGQAEGRP